MKPKRRPSAPSLRAVSRYTSRALAPLVMVLACVVLHGGCTCAAPGSPPPSGVIACKPQHPTRATVPAAASEVETVAAGSVPVSFSVTSGGQAALLMSFRPVPGGALVPEVG